MNSHVTAEFLDAFRRLPVDIQEKARRCYRLWRSNPSHPSLKFKRVHRQEPIFSVRIGLGWRALGFVEGGDVTWFWIGSHADYDKILTQD